MESDEERKKKLEGLYDQLQIIEDDILHVKAEETALLAHKQTIIDQIDDLKKQAINFSSGSFEIKAEQMKGKLL